jgi:hypothetical protein
MPSPRGVSTVGLWIVGIFNALTAVGGGIGLIETNGLGMPLSFLDASPFTSYLWPGLILLFVVGGTQALAVTTLYRRSAWAPAAAAVAGFGLIIWIYVEVVILPGYMWLHTMSIVSGILQVAFALGALGVVPESDGLRTRSAV